MADDDREQWSQVPGTAELWASDGGRVATLKYDGAGFNILPPRTDQFGELFVMFEAKGKSAKRKRFVAALVLVAFGHRRPGSRRVGYRDDDPSNCRLSNLAWVLRGESRVIDLTKRRCLGKNCGVNFMSHGPGNRLCPTCTNRVSKVTLSGLEGTEESSDLPDEPLLGGGHHR